MAKTYARPLTPIFYLYLDQAGKSRGSKTAVLTLLALSYEPGAVIALAISVLEATWTRDKKFAIPAIISSIMLLYYIRFPINPPVSITPTGISVAGGVSYPMWDALRYTITCFLLLSPSIVIYRIWEEIGRAVKATIVILLIVFLTPVVSTISVVDQHRWYLMLLSILTPYTILALTKISKRFAAVIILLLALIGSAYPLTPQGHYYFNIWASVSTPYAYGYPWSLTPAIGNISEIELAAEIVEPYRLTTTLVPFDLYPALHIFIRNPSNIIILQQVSIFPVVDIMKKLGIQKAIAVTYTNMTKELEELIKSNSTTASQIKLEKLREDGINIYVVELENSTIATLVPQT